ncbi:carbonic anhydrase [Halioxenophilus aromaticivorans]|uniref:Carbonic anhydrase n=1 Tax=Halioxenophilus aromaticivorans TaxID=1306992 RepID=A0AAV3U295_9ALTE
MEEILKGVKKFQQEVVPGRKEEFAKLAYGQEPEVLFITCSDSRIDPCLLTQTVPGKLFICRNAGNVVPPHSNQTGGMTASIEYAVEVLKIRDIIICGHTHCGAMQGAIQPQALDGIPHVKEWLGHCRAASAVVKERHGDLNADYLDEITKENIKLQLQHIRTHPSVAAKVATGQVHLHGWMYEIETGQVQALDQDSGAFNPL